MSPPDSRLTYSGYFGSRLRGSVVNFTSVPAYYSLKRLIRPFYFGWIRFCTCVPILWDAPPRLAIKFALSYLKAYLAKPHKKTAFVTEAFWVSKRRSFYTMVRTITCTYMSLILVVRSYANSLIINNSVISSSKQLYHGLNACDLPWKFDIDSNFTVFACC